MLPDPFILLTHYFQDSHIPIGLTHGPPGSRIQHVKKDIRMLSNACMPIEQLMSALCIYVSSIIRDEIHVYNYCMQFMGRPTA